MTDQSRRSLVEKLDAHKAIVAEHIEHLHIEVRERPPIPHMAPSAPPVFVGRNEELLEPITVLKLDTDSDGALVLSALNGMGGVGKTTLAKALANHPDIEAALPDGTLWASLGPEPDVMSWLMAWGKQFDGDFGDYTS